MNLRPSYKLSESGSYQAVIRDGKRIVWTGKVCGNRDFTTSRNWGATDIAKVVLQCINGEREKLEEQLRLGYESLSRSMGHPGADGHILTVKASLDRSKAKLAYAIRESEKFLAEHADTGIDT